MSRHRHRTHQLCEIRETPKPYTALAAKIIEGRSALGYTQAAFAAELGFKQQAASRWEAGTHRPTVRQIPTLAALIDDDVATLMQLAGYSSPVSASVSTQFPVDALAPDTFEQFVADVVEALHPTADVRVQGSRGHKQEGTDVLLGPSELGPWLTAEDYFAPFKGRGAVFSHDWSLVGRESEIAALVEALRRDDMPLTLLIGSGGIGKTRVLKEAIERFEAESTGTATRFLSASQEPDAASLEALGTGRKVLVVDDAHDRAGLNLLIEYTVDRRHKARLLIASRPYAEQRIRNELALYSIVDPSMVRLARLEKQALHALVVEVLREFGGDPEWADRIVAIAADSPLVAAMAARVAARDRINPELARGKQELRQIVLARFTRVITGDLGTPADAALLRALLEVLAIIQPFHVDDRRVAELVEVTRPSIAASDVSRALKMLIDGGVIYKRGQLTG